jgi:hypothetical protein
MLGVFIMGPIPFSAFALVIVVLLITWLFLAHMISSRRDDARLQFLLSLTDPPHVARGCPDPAIPRPAASVPETNAAEPWRDNADEFMSRSYSGIARFVSQELPVVFAAALRSRAM